MANSMPPVNMHVQPYGILAEGRKGRARVRFFREVSRNDCIAKDARRLHLKEETQQIKMIVETKRELT